MHNMCIYIYIPGGEPRQQTLQWLIPWIRATSSFPSHIQKSAVLKFFGSSQNDAYNKKTYDIYIYIWLINHYKSFETNRQTEFQQHPIISKQTPHSEWWSSFIGWSAMCLHHRFAWHLETSPEEKRDDRCDRCHVSPPWWWIPVLYRV